MKRCLVWVLATVRNVPYSVQKGIFLRSAIKLIALLILTSAISSCNGSAKPIIPPRAGTRLVLASIDSDNQIVIRMSIDGLVWTEPIPVYLDGTPADSEPLPAVAETLIGMFFDGTLYHLYWIRPDGTGMFALSSDPTNWTVRPVQDLHQAYPLAVGKRDTLALISHDDGELYIWDVHESIGTRDPMSVYSTIRPAIAYGNDKFVVAVGDEDGNLLIYESANGSSWSLASELPNLNPSLLHLSFAEDRFLLLSTYPRCHLYASSNAQLWEETNLPCTSSTDYQVATRVQGENIILENPRNEFMAATKDSLIRERINVYGAIDKSVVASGPGPQLASVKLNRVSVEVGSGHDLDVPTLGFRVRVGEPGSARVTLKLTGEFAVGVDSGESRQYPLAAQPYAWIVKPPERLLDDDGHIDILGVVVIGIERGDCPYENIIAEIEVARESLREELEVNIAQAQLSILMDPTNRELILEKIENRVIGSMEQGSLSLAESFIGCGLNEDQALDPDYLLLYGSELAPQDPEKNIFRLYSSRPSDSFDRLFLVWEDKDDDDEQPDMQWQVSGTYLFQGLP